jgi:hypothetical protein
VKSTSERHSGETPVEQEEPPPFLWKWKWVYGAVVIYTLLIVLALYWITVALNY